MPVKIIILQNSLRAKNPSITYSNVDDAIEYCNNNTWKLSKKINQTTIIIKESTTGIIKATGVCVDGGNNSNIPDLLWVYDTGEIHRVINRENIEIDDTDIFDLI